ncbi:hypothetical protein WJX81_003239 [Elliptochloris bilobata]|uniref:DNA replication checkpoint mediator MRC1 domain-containing protein n=1 Tax=Elliptochloris bilobata TaxID=381761 RepID=A0AAW1SCR3_9CHLO
MGVLNTARQRRDGSGSASTDAGSAGPASSGRERGGDSDSEAESAGAPPADAAQIRAETQRVLREAAKSDRIGRGSAPVVQPLAGVLDKLLQIKQRAISRAHKAAPAERVVAPEGAASARAAGAAPGKILHPVDPQPGDDDDLVAPAQRRSLFAMMRAAPLGDTQDLGFDSEPQDAPGTHADGSTWAGLRAASQGEALRCDAPGLGLRLDSVTQVEWDVAPQREALVGSGPGLGLRLDSVTQAGVDSEAQGEALAAIGPHLCLRLDSETQPGYELDEGDHPGAAGAPAGPRAPADPKADGRPEALREVPAVYALGREPARDEAMADAEGHEDGGQEEEEEEEEGLSGSSSSSDDEDEEEEEEADQEGARAAALAEARLLLRDRPPRRRQHGQLVEEEAEMSEDAGHSGSDSDAGDDAEGVLADLIGAGTERRGDERRRAALHAEWAAVRDEEDIKELMEGVKGGFRKRRRAGALDDAGGSHRDARWRRARAASSSEGSDDEGRGEGSDDEGSGSGSDCDSRGAGGKGDPGDPYAALEDISDDEAREELRREQQQRLLAASQEGLERSLLDDESRALLGLLARPDPALATPAAGRGARGAGAGLGSGPAPRPGAFGTDLTNRRAAASFLGRAQHSMSQARRAPQGGGSTSYVFGCDATNSAPVQEDAPQAGQPAAANMGATSFAGLRDLVRAELTPGPAVLWVNDAV